MIDLKQIDRVRVASFLVLLFYSVGLAGFLLVQTQVLFEKLVPFHLLLMLLLMVWSHPRRERRFYLSLLVIYLAGFAVEAIGVNSGVVFGRYSYDTTLGLKVAGTPLMIGVNWVLVIYSTGTTIRSLGIRNSYLAAAAGGALVTLLDFFIEPVAIRFHYWHWDSPAVPLQNYIAWFFVAFVLLLFFLRMPVEKHNKAGVALFVVQFLFFVILWASI